MSAATDTATLGARLAKLWWAERCAWHLDFDEMWILTLEWTQERGNDHHADWVTFHWLFYADTAEDAVADAVEWCEGLVPFERCGACDGRGGYGAWGGDTVACDACRGTGLAHSGMA